MIAPFLLIQCLAFGISAFVGTFQGVPFTLPEGVNKPLGVILFAGLPFGFVAAGCEFALLAARMQDGLNLWHVRLIGLAFTFGWLLFTLATRIAPLERPQSTPWDVLKHES